MQKSLKVFFRNWKGLALVCAVLLLIVGAAEFDLFGYERRVPAPDTVESVSLNRCELREPENVAAAVALHQSLVDHKRMYDGESNGFGVSQVDTTVLQPGDVIDFICDYYGYDGTYQESFYLGDQMVVPSDGELTVENVSLEALRLKIAYVFTDIYNQERWTESVDR